MAECVSANGCAYDNLLSKFLLFISNRSCESYFFIYLDRSRTKWVNKYQYTETFMYALHLCNVWSDRNIRLIIIVVLVVFNRLAPTQVPGEQRIAVVSRYAVAVDTSAWLIFMIRLSISHSRLVQCELTLSLSHPRSRL